MGKKKNAVMIADTRPALVGDILIQLQKTNKDLFDEAIIYYIDLPDSDRTIMNSIMPCRFIKYSPPLPDELFQKERFHLFSVIMFARYEMYQYLSEFETVTWLDTDILIQGSLAGLIEEGKKTGFALIREDEENKTDKKPDHMRTCFTQPLSGYDMEAYLYCSGTVVVTDKLAVQNDYTDWCYKKTVEWADILSLPDQGVLNAFVQENSIDVTALNGSKFCCFPYYGRDCSQAEIIHAWGGNKFWNDWYLCNQYPFWKNCYDQWIEMGGTPLSQTILPKVSVIIPVYKPNLETFGQCIDSLLNQCGANGQRYSDFEVIIVSEPFNQQEISDFIDHYKDSRLQLVFNEQRLGIAASLNKALRLAKGTYIARIDDDDIANTERIAKQVRYLDTHKAVTLCTTDFHYFGDMNQKRVSFGGDMARAWSIFTCPFDHPTIMFRKQFFADNNLFYDETRGYVEDWELWLRAFDKGMTVGCIHEVLFYHRWHNGSAGQADKTFQMMRELVHKNFQKLGVEVSPEELAYIAPWNGKVNDSEYERLQQIFDEALSKNSILGIYDQKCLFKVFSLRLNEAKTGVMPEICFTLAAGNGGMPQYAGEWNPEKPKLFRGLMKRVLKPLYRPVRHRFEDRLINIERMAGELQTEVLSIQPTVSALKQEQDKLAYSIQELQWIVQSNLQNVQKSLDVDLQNAQKSLCADIVSNISKTYNEINQRIDGLVQFQNDVNNKFNNHNVHSNFADSYFLTNCYLDRKIFLIGTPDHDNIGDAAITLGTYEFIKSYFSGYKVVEVTGYQIEEKFALMNATISDDDLIFLQGGGNLGNMYLLEENIRRKVISNFPNNKIVILTQTVYFDDTEKGKEEVKISADIYNRHTNLTLLTRGKQSLSFAQQHFQNVRSYNALDMALMLDRNYYFDRQGVLLCIRDLIDESGLDSDSYEQIHRIVGNYDAHYEETQNRYAGEIPPALRGIVVNEELQKFAKHKVIVTDRLHGMIFSIITHTPCVVIRSYTQKIEEFSEFFKDSNAVSYIGRDIGKLESEINRMRNVKEPVYPVLQNHPFEEIYKAIQNNAVL